VTQYEYIRGARYIGARMGVISNPGMKFLGVTIFELTPLPAISGIYGT